MKKSLKTKTVGANVDNVKRGYNEKNPAQPHGSFNPDSSLQPKSTSKLTQPDKVNNGLSRKS